MGLLHVTTAMTAATIVAQKRRGPTMDMRRRAELRETLAAETETYVAKVTDDPGTHDDVFSPVVTAAQNLAKELYAGEWEAHYMRLVDGALGEALS